MTCDKKCCPNIPLNLKDAEVGMKLKCIDPSPNAIFGGPGDIYEITKITDHGFIMVKNLTKGTEDSYGVWACHRFVKFNECNCAISHDPIRTALTFENAKVGMTVMAIDQCDSTFGAGQIFRIIHNDGHVINTGEFISVQNIHTGVKEYGWSPARFYCLSEVKKETPPVKEEEKIMNKVNAVTMDPEGMTKADAIKMIAAVGKHFNGPVETASTALMDLLEKAPVDCSVQGRHTVIILPTAVPIIGVATCHLHEENKAKIGERLALQRAIYHFFGHAGCTLKTPNEVRAEWLQKEINRLRRELNSLKK